MELHTTTLFARVSAQVSADDGQKQNITQLVGASAFMTNMADMLAKLFNRLTVPSCTLVSGGSAPAVALALPTVDSGDGGIHGLWHGVPFRISATGTISGDPSSALNAITASQMDTTSTTVRKVLVCLSLGDISAVTSSIASNVGTLTFVNGSTYNVSYSLQASTGGVSAVFNKVPTPKASGNVIPVGILNIPNSYTSGDGLANTMMTFPLRELYGVNLSAVFGSAVEQP